jgi:hypothetical protein
MNFIGKIYEISLSRKSIRTERFQTPEVVRIRETRLYILKILKILKLRIKLKQIDLNQLD